MQKILSEQKKTGAEDETRNEGDRNLSKGPTQENNFLGYKHQNGSG